MAQFVNNTDERIVLEPGEGVSGSATIHQYESAVYRLILDEKDAGPKDADKFPTTRDYLDKKHDIE